MQRNTHWRVFSCALPLMATTPGFAAEEPAFDVYGGIDYQFVRINAEYDDFTVKALSFLGGKSLSEHWSIEGFFSLGIDDDTQESNNGCVEETYELNNLLGLQLKGQRNITQNLSAWLTFGISQTSVSNDVNNGCPFKVGNVGREVDESESDISYGLGAEWRLTADSSVLLGFTQYYDDGINSDELRVRAINIGYRVNF